MTDDGVTQSAVLLLSLGEEQAAEVLKQQRLVPYEHVNRAGLDATGLQHDVTDHRAALADIRQLLKQGQTRQALERMRELQRIAPALGAVR